MQIKSLLVLLCFIALTLADYSLYYTAYTDNHCGTENTAMSGQIYPYVCGPEYATTRSGMITYIDTTYLTSCDYKDTQCASLKLCQNYTNAVCYTAGSAQFSNMYTYGMVGGKYQVNYTNYANRDCSGTPLVLSTIYENVCGLEYDNPRSGKITAITDTWLTSCDYSDTQCQTLMLCQNYTNDVCSDTAWPTFSDIYSWTVQAATPAPTAAPTGAATSAPTPAPATNAPTSAPTNAPGTGGLVLTYTAYTDNHCGTVNTAMSGQIYPYVCAPEFATTRSGKITYIDESMLTSCDYNDMACADLKLCQNYNRNQCYNSGAGVEFSNMYAWTMVNGQWQVTYTSYNNMDCTGQANVVSIIYENVCGAEYENPRSGMITYMTATWLTSCDYSDTACKNLILCENYTNHQCSDSAYTGFSDVYSWNYNGPAATPAPTPAPSHGSDASTANAGGSTSSSNNNGNSAEYKIAYVSYTDNTCTDVNYAQSGEIFAYQCALEYRSAPTSGMIVFINMDYLISCDYTDTECADLKLCENYTNAVCYDSGDAAFSNQYTWTMNSNGVYQINYSSYSAQGCKAPATVSGPIFANKCALEHTVTPQSGMITYINDQYLTSCDYSDMYCQDLILCQNYNNTECNASPVTAFSDRYAWERNSSAASLAAGFIFIFAAVFAMF